MSSSSSLGSSEDVVTGVKDTEEIDMPWSNFQEWALRDNLPKYVVSIPIAGDTSGRSRLVALWRTLSNEVTELSGYDVCFLRKMHQRMVAKRAAKKGDSDASKEEDDDREMDVTPDVLPYLDEFEFESNGGVSGRVYGLPGVADGAPVRTPPVSDVQNTVILGYTRTDDGSVAYELGTPAGDFYSLDGTGRAASLAAARRLALETISGTASMMTNGGGEKAIKAVSGAVGSGETRDMLVNLGGATGILLAGATAFNMISHHLTVNIFWV